MKLRYARVCASQRRSRRKTPHFNFLRNPEPTTTPAGRVVLTVFAGVAQFERSLIGIRTEEGRRTAQARDVPFERSSKLRPDQRILARQLIEQEGQSVSEVAQPSAPIKMRQFIFTHTSGPVRGTQCSGPGCAERVSAQRTKHRQLAAVGVVLAPRIEAAAKAGEGIQLDAAEVAALARPPLRKRKPKR